MAQKTLIIEQGILVADDQNPLTTRQRGSVLLPGIHLIEKKEMTL